MTRVFEVFGPISNKSRDNQKESRKPEGGVAQGPLSGWAGGPVCEHMGLGWFLQAASAARPRGAPAGVGGILVTKAVCQCRVSNWGGTPSVSWQRKRVWGEFLRVRDKSSAEGLGGKPEGLWVYQA